MQVDIVDMRNDCQLMYDKGKQLAFISNAENVYFSGPGRQCIDTLPMKKKNI